MSVSVTCPACGRSRSVKERNKNGYHCGSCAAGRRMQVVRLRAMRATVHRVADVLEQLRVLVRVTGPYRHVERQLETLEATYGVLIDEYMEQLLPITRSGQIET